MATDELTAQYCQRSTDLLTRFSTDVNKAKIYFIWPVYEWPDQSPIGLQTQTLLTVAWSVTRQSQRRLLQNPPDAYNSYIVRPRIYKLRPKRPILIHTKPKVS